MMAFVFFLFILLPLPSNISAQTVSVISDKNTHNKEDTFLVSVKLNSQGKQINSLGGTVLVPRKLFDVFDIETGESFISMWTERPEIINNDSDSANSNNTEINFSGGLPGGYSGSDGTIFTFVLKAKNEGVGEISIKDFTALLNDGKGTVAPSITLTPLESLIKKDSTIPIETYLAKRDDIPPEPFGLSISRDVSIGNNRYFISFFAVDKGSGINKYDVEEDPWLIYIFGFKKVWSDSQTPQILYYQNWPSTVKVRAVDGFGNTTEEKVFKSIDFSIFSQHKTLYIILLLTLLFILGIIKRKKWYNKSK